MALKEKSKKALSIKTRRRIRKTISAIFLISAIVIAAIPSDNLRAAREAQNFDDGLTADDIHVDIDHCSIPIVPNDATIYTTGDGLYQFAYVNVNGSTTEAGNKFALILGYSNSGNLAGNRLVIPDTLDAYSKYTDTVSSTGGYVAVGKSGNFLYYFSHTLVTPATTYQQQKRDENGVLLYKEDGSPDMETIVQDAVYNDEYIPCYYTDYVKWKDIPDDGLYYDPSGKKPSDPSFRATLTTTENYQRIKSAQVAWIGNQYLQSTPDGWAIAGKITNAEQGIFCNNGQIRYLEVGEDLTGIGQYAFYGCSALSSITVGNGIRVICDYAFAQCINLKNFNFNSTSNNLTDIGAYAFYFCDQLTSFDVPTNTINIGQGAFMHCSHMTKLSLAPEGLSSNLRNIGDWAFADCASIETISIPELFTNTLNISVFYGCSKLKNVKVTNRYVTFSPNTSLANPYSFETFRKEVDPNFYFIGPSPAADGTKAALHVTSSTNEIAYCYDEDGVNLYELTVETAPGSGHYNIFRVNENNELTFVNIHDSATDIVLPDKIGPYNINSIDSAFQNYCYIRTIKIPGSVTSISTDAFKGCHNLKDIFYADASSITFIGKDAFKTQESPFIGAKANSSSQSYCSKCHNDLVAEPQVNFIGSIGDNIVPFNYAMSADNYINNSYQKRGTYITYYSGWPSNLVIKYNSNKQAAELVAYPTLNAYIASDFITYEKNQFGIPTLSYSYLTADMKNAGAEGVNNYIQGNDLSQIQQEAVDSALKILLPKGIKTISDNLFVIAEANELSNPSVDIKKSITAYGLENVADRGFKDCINLYSITLDGTTSIGDYAFENCDNLEVVSLPMSISALGKRPFASCDALKEISFNGSPYYTCDNSIIYGLENGQKAKIIEVLESRSGMINEAEMNGISSMEAEAFKDSQISYVDLSQSSIKVIPENAFYNSDKLQQIILPATITGIKNGAFKDCDNLTIFKIPAMNAIINNDAFDTKNDYPGLTFGCNEESTAYIYATENGFRVDTTAISKFYKVEFYDDQFNLLSSVPAVVAGGDAPEPVAPTKDGYTFKGWNPSPKGIQGDTFCIAQYELIDTSLPVYKVQFINYDDKIVSEQNVTQGQDAIIPQSPVREGYTFTGWRPSTSNVTENIKSFAQFEKNTVSSGSNGGNGGNSGTNATPAPTPAVLYNLTVKNGSGSGSYVAGSSPVIIANDPAEGYEFDHWTISPETAKLASSVLTATVVQMPAGDVTVTAHYKAKSGVSTPTPSPLGNATGNSPSSGTTVVIDKNGLSNTGVVQVTINGSSDKFQLKISEQSAATEEIVRALTNEFGNSLEGIRYFPMDISLYDASGKTKIYDTTGLSVTITVPIPDSMIKYAGNNKIAAVSNSKLEKLQAKYTTIDGVSCITFTAEHFSPYVIYVNTQNMSAKPPVADNTPQTGDFINPKWFVSLALLAASVFLFFKKDKRVVAKA